jgi:ketosteroid isomerase-like protein
VGSPGREAIVAYLRDLADPFPDVRLECEAKHESANVTIDEWYTTDTHSAALPMPTGETTPATGKQVRVRGCDIATVEGGRITSHRIYFEPNGALDNSVCFRMHEGLATILGNGVDEVGCLPWWASACSR